MVVQLFIELGLNVHCYCLIFLHPCKFNCAPLQISKNVFGLNVQNLHLVFGLNDVLNLAWALFQSRSLEHPADLITLHVVLNMFTSPCSSDHWSSISVLNMFLHFITWVSGEKDLNCGRVYFGCGPRTLHHVSSLCPKTFFYHYAKLASVYIVVLMVYCLIYHMILEVRTTIWWLLLAMRTWQGQCAFGKRTWRANKYCLRFYDFLNMSPCISVRCWMSYLLWCWISCLRIIWTCLHIPLALCYQHLQW